MKKNIIVFDTAADASGAYTVLKSFYDHAKTRTDINWIFVLGKVNFSECANVKTINFEWTKKSWGHRLFFDLFVAPRLVKKYKPNLLISLENMGFPTCNIRQSVFLHQPLFVTNCKIPIKKSPKLWFYKNILSKWCHLSLKKASKIVVQTDWMKQSLADKINQNKTLVEKISPTVDSEGVEFTPIQTNFRRFFYPATPLFYKNHEIIFRACKILNSNGIKNYEIVLTVPPDNKIAQRVSESSPNVKFIGSIPRKEVFELYAKSILLFPSFLESFGYPLAEARSIGSPIIAADTPFSKEILENYPNAYFFDYKSPEELAAIMKKTMENALKYTPDKKSETVTYSYWEQVVNALTE